MPGLSGFELAKLIKGTQADRQIPILFLTAHLLDEQDVLAGYGAGAVDYLDQAGQPADPATQGRRVRRLFRKTRALAELNEKLEARVRERTAELAEREREPRAFTDNTPDLPMRFDSASSPPRVAEPGGGARVGRVRHGEGDQHLGGARRLQTAFDDRRARCAFEYQVAGEESQSFTPTRLMPEIHCEGTIEHVLAITHDITERGACRR